MTDSPAASCEGEAGGTDEDAAEGQLAGNLQHALPRALPDHLGEGAARREIHATESPQGWPKSCRLAQHFD